VRHKLLDSFLVVQLMCGMCLYVCMCTLIHVSKRIRVCCACMHVLLLVVVFVVMFVIVFVVAFMCAYTS